MHQVSECHFSLVLFHVGNAQYCGKKDRAGSSALIFEPWSRAMPTSIDAKALLADRVSSNVTNVIIL